MVENSVKYHIKGNPEEMNMKFSDCASTQKRHMENAKQYIMKEHGIKNPKDITIDGIATTKEDYSLL